MYRLTQGRRGSGQKRTSAYRREGASGNEQFLCIHTLKMAPKLESPFQGTNLPQNLGPIFLSSGLYISLQGKNNISTIIYFTVKLLH